MLRRLFRDWADGLRAGLEVLWWGQAYPRTFPLRRGGSMPSYRPDPDAQIVTLSPGWVELPPGSKDHYPAEIIARINQPRR